VPSKEKSDWFCAIVSSWQPASDATADRLGNVPLMMTLWFSMMMGCLTLNALGVAFPAANPCGPPRRGRRCAFGRAEDQVGQSERGGAVAAIGITDGIEKILMVDHIQL